MYNSVKMAMIVGAINRYIPLGYVHLHVKYPWAQSSLACTLTLRLSALALASSSNTSGLGPNLEYQ